MSKAGKKMQVAKILLDAAAEALSVDEAGDVDQDLKRVKEKADRKIDQALT